jgi:hypothetical protein
MVQTETPNWKERRRKGDECERGRDIYRKEEKKKRTEEVEKKGKKKKKLYLVRISFGKNRNIVSTLSRQI